jgi:hypothetical protein
MKHHDIIALIAAHTAIVATYLGFLILVIRWLS